MSMLLHLSCIFFLLAEEVFKHTAPHNNHSAVGVSLDLHFIFPVSLLINLSFSAFVSPYLPADVYMATFHKGII